MAKTLIAAAILSASALAAARPVGDMDPAPVALAANGQSICNGLCRVYATLGMIPSAEKCPEEPPWFPNASKLDRPYNLLVMGWTGPRNGGDHPVGK